MPARLEVDLGTLGGFESSADGVNEAGQVHVPSVNHEELERYLSDDQRLAERRLGPLAPGRYTVTATTPDGRTATRTVELAAEPVVQDVRLELTP